MTPRGMDADALQRAGRSSPCRRLLLPGAALAGLGALLAAVLPHAALDAFFRGWPAPLAVAVATACLLKPRTGDWGAALSLLGSIALTGMPLLWVFSCRSLWHAPYVFAGMLPSHDAEEYFWCAQNLLRGESIPPTIFDRPLFFGFLAPVLVVTDMHLRAVLALCALFNGACLWHAARVLCRVAGPAAAALLLLLVHFIYRITAGTMMTEQLALGLGLLAAAGLLQGWLCRDHRTTALGLFWLAFALQTRPAALFMLPAVWLLLSTDGWRCGQWRALLRRGLLFALPLVAASAINAGLKNVFFEKNPTQNFWNVGYAITHGLNSWTDAVKATGGNWQLARDATVRKVKSDPLCLIRATVRAQRDTFAQGQFWRFNGRGSGAPLWCTLAVCGLLFPGFNGTMRRWWRLNLAVWLGFLASVTFASHSITGFRIYAATAPIQMLLVCHAAWQVMRAMQLLLTRLQNPVAWFGCVGCIGAIVAAVEYFAFRQGLWLGLAGGGLLGAVLTLAHRFLSPATLPDPAPASHGWPAAFGPQGALLAGLVMLPLLSFGIGRLGWWPERISRNFRPLNDAARVIPAGAQVHFVTGGKPASAPFVSKQAYSENPRRRRSQPQSDIIFSTSSKFSIGPCAKGTVCAFLAPPGEDFQPGALQPAGIWEGVRLSLDPSVIPVAKVSPVLPPSP